MNDEAPAAEPAGLSATSLRAFASIALLSVALGRAFARALPGSGAGMGTWIARFDVAAAFVSQLACVSASFLILKVLLALRRDSHGGTSYWLSMLPAGLCTSFAIAATQNPLTPELMLGLGVLSVFVLVVALPRALSSSHSRAAGLISALCACSALLHLASRVMAVHAVDQSLRALFDLARSAATLGFVFDVLAVAVAIVWFAGRQTSVLAATSTGLLVVSLLLAWLAQRGAQSDAPLGSILLMRSLDALLRNPEPFIGAPLRRALELVIFGMSALLALSFRQKPVLQVATALMLLSRACADVPAFGLFLATGALLCNLGSFSEHGAARIS